MHVIIMCQQGSNSCWKTSVYEILELTFTGGNIYQEAWLESVHRSTEAMAPASLVSAADLQKRGRLLNDAQQQIVDVVLQIADLCLDLLKVCLTLLQLRLLTL